MEHKKKKELRIRSCLTGAIWLALAFSMLISALLFAFLNHFLDLPGKIPGLGLALVKRIVDIAGGTIKAENREYGGCRFVVQLPINNYNE